MKKTVVAAMLASACLSSAALAASPHWSYEGHEGPEFWGNLAPDYATCSAGQQQSPIDIENSIEADISSLKIDWNPKAVWTVQNNGHTIQLSSDDGGSIQLGGKTYKLLQFHFHTPSEHAIAGKRSPMEVHFVHKADDGSLAVVGVMMTGGGDSDIFDAVMKAAPKEVASKSFGAADADALLPEDNEAYVYEGSLTTPPCSEVVTWLVLKEPIAVADADIDAFKALIGENARPLQPVNRRFVLTN